MNIAIIGGGAIGAALAGAWQQAGHHVTLGLRGQGRTAGIPGVAACGIPQALRSAGIIVLAVPASAVPGLCAEHASLLRDKIVIDPTVTFGGAPLNQHQALSAAGVRYVRAFSTQGPEVLTAPVIAGQPADQFYTADDEEARDTAATLIAATGLRPVCVGGSDRVSVVDGVTRLWFALAVKQGLGRHTGFRLLTDTRQGGAPLFPGRVLATGRRGHAASGRTLRGWRWRSR